MKQSKILSSKINLMQMCFQLNLLHMRLLFNCMNSLYTFFTVVFHCMYFFIIFLFVCDPELLSLEMPTESVLFEKEC